MYVHSCLAKIFNYLDFREVAISKPSRISFPKTYIMYAGRTIHAPLSHVSKLCSNIARVKHEDLLESNPDEDEIEPVVVANVVEA